MGKGASGAAGPARWLGVLLRVARCFPRQAWSKRTFTMMRARHRACRSVAALPAVYRIDNDDSTGTGGPPSYGAGGRWLP